MDRVNGNLQLVIKSFREVSRAFYHFFREEADRLEITVIQLLVLLKLSDEKEMSLGQISDDMQMSNSTMSGVIDRLVHAGLVKRERAENDRRVIILKLTQEGMEKKNEAFGPNSQLIGRLDNLNMSDDEIKTLFALHQKLLSHLENKEDISEYE